MVRCPVCGGENKRTSNWCSPDCHALGMVFDALAADQKPLPADYARLWDENAEAKLYQYDEKERSCMTVWTDEMKGAAILDAARVCEFDVAVREALARLDDWSADNLTDESARDWIGHVEPALERLRRLTPRQRKER